MADGAIDVRGIWMCVPGVNDDMPDRSAVTGIALELNVAV